jgi:hypothetical protein
MPRLTSRTPCRCISRFGLFIVKCAIQRCFILMRLNPTHCYHHQIKTEQHSYISHVLTPSTHTQASPHSKSTRFRWLLSTIKNVPFGGYSNKVGNYPMYRNDEIGNCAIAGPAHQIQTWSANDGEETRPGLAGTLVEAERRRRWMSRSIFLRCEVTDGGTTFGRSQSIQLPRSVMPGLTRKLFFTRVFAAGPPR